MGGTNIGEQVIYFCSHGCSGSLVIFVWVLWLYKFKSLNNNCNKATKRKQNVATEQLSLFLLFPINVYLD